MEGDGEQGRQTASEGWENRLAAETDEQKQTLANMPCQCAISGDLKIATLKEEQQYLVLPSAPVTAEPNKGLI